MSLNLFTNSNFRLEQYGFVNTFQNQNYILSYMHPLNPYRSLITCFEVGLGKTYAAACLCHLYLIFGYKVLYLSNSLASLSNFKKEYNKVIMDSRLNSLEHNIDYLTFSKFYNQEKRNVEMTNYGLIIIDEVHNLRESAIRYNVIKSRLDKLLNSKLLIITATPMIDSSNELDSIVQLTNEKSKIVFSENKTDNTIIKEYVGIKISNEVLFLSKMKGKQLEDYNNSLNNNDTVFTNTRQASITYNGKYNKNIPLDEQSSKIAKFIDSIKEGELTVVFCFYIKRGINFLCDVLDNFGYTKWNPLSTGKTYAVIDGRTTDKEVNEILNTFNSIANINGDKIHILIGSSVLSESITLYRISHLHILSPFWNYGQIEQSIGRAIRIGSHEGMKKKHIKIYLHAAYSEKGYKGKDIDIWKIAYQKKIEIDRKLKELKAENIIDYQYLGNLEIPEVDNNLVIRIKEWVWDLRNCFDTNKFKISWCNVYYENAVGYNTKNNTKILGKVPDYIKINIPNKEGYTIWRSCIDNKLRLSFIDGDLNKFSKRGKLVENINIKEIANKLNCEASLFDIIRTLKKQNRYFDKQIEYVI